MINLMKYTLIASILFLGTWNILSTLDRAYARIDIECQEGC